MSKLRTAAERFARGKKVKRKLPNGVEFYVSPDSQLKYLKTKFDEDLVALSNAYVTDQSVVWDVGANCGVMTFCSAGAKQIAAIEADPFLTSMIQESMQLNDVPVSIVSAAVSSSVGIAEFVIAKRGRASNHLASVAGRSQAGGERARMLVPTVTLDSLLEKLEPPTLIKIDVEGAEVGVLEGAEHILNAVRPVIYLETGRGTHKACERILNAAGYSLTKGEGLNWLCKPD